MSLLSMLCGLFKPAEPLPGPIVIAPPTVFVPANWPLFAAAVYDRAAIVPDKLGEALSIAATILARRAVYAHVEELTGFPWWWIGAIHDMESGLSFTTHLHNGDPLTARTVHVPAGRPVNGNPPFAWTDSAADALNGRGLARGTVFDMATSLAEAERYNGMGYRNRGIRSPYLWAATSAEQPGKFVSDGHFDPLARSAQIGVAAIWKALTLHGVKTV